MTAKEDAEDGAGPCDPAGSPRERFRRGVGLGLPYAVVGFFLSLSFGVLALQAGFTVAQAIATAMLVFAGSAQFAALAIVASVGTFSRPPRPPR